MPLRQRAFALAAAIIALLAASPAGAAVLRVPRLPPGAHELGALARTSTVHATVALTPRNSSGLAAYARAVSDPSSPLYHRYLTVAQFADRFAPTRAQVAAVRASLRRRGLTTGTIAANGLELSITASAGKIETAFSTGLRKFALSGGETGFASTSAATVDPSVAGLVQGVVGLNTLAPSAPHIVRRGGIDRPAARRIGHTATAGVAGPQACSPARIQASADGSYTTSQIADRYHLDALYGAGVLGRGVTVAVYELEPFSATDVAAFQSCFGTSDNVTVTSVDGGAGTGSGSGEAAMDVEDVLGMAPQANVRVYEGPATGSGAYDTYARIVSDDVAQVVTTSWGLCEAFEGASAAAAENTLFQEAAVQGQSVFASSGDTGSDDCGNGRQAVDDPSSQPWVTGVGATSIGTGTESAWNDGYGATGGGVSSLWARPSYQDSAAQAQGAVTCGDAGTSCREVPDVTADGDPDTGYVIFWRGHWNTMGGTSISTPTWAAMAALADSSAGCASHPVGFANPALYRVAATAYAFDFGDITTGTNGYDHIAGFAAGHGYDMASGLGVPDAATLVPALCGDSLTFAGPVAQRSAGGHAVTLTVHGSSSTGAAVTYSATGLPTGLAIASGSGTISGRPTRAGRYTVTVTATDADGASAQVGFTWTVTAAAKATTARASGSAIALARIVRRVTRRDARVRFAVPARNRDGLVLRFTAAGLPAGLHIGARSGVIAGRPRRAGRYAVTVRVTDATGAHAVVRFRWTIRR